MKKDPGPIAYTDLCISLYDPFRIPKRFSDSTGRNPVTRCNAPHCNFVYAGTRPEPSYDKSRGLNPTSSTNRARGCVLMEIGLREKRCRMYLNEFFCSNKEYVVNFYCRSVFIDVTSRGFVFALFEIPLYVAMVVHSFAKSFNNRRVQPHSPRLISHPRDPPRRRSTQNPCLQVARAATGKPSEKGDA